MRNRELQFPFPQEIIPGDESNGGDGGQGDGKKRNREEGEGGKKNNTVFPAAAVSETLLYHTHSYTAAHTHANWLDLASPDLVCLAPDSLTP